MDDAERLDTLQVLLSGMYVEFKNKSFKQPIEDNELQEELRWLETVDILTLISYIDSLFEIMVDLRIDDANVLVRNRVEKALQKKHEQGKYDISNDASEFEKIIVKLEGEVRNHISV